MCSVVGCESWRRSVQRFKLPEDPEIRLAWVQFLLEVNGQRLKEESWTDITVCAEHFFKDSFEKHTKPGTVQLKPSAVPLVCVKSCEHLDLPVTPVVVHSEYEDAHLDNPVPDSVDVHLHSLQKREPVETAEVACQCGNTEMSRCLQSSSKSSDHTLADVDTSRFEKMQEAMSTEVEKEKAPFLQIKGKYEVNENCLLQLFPRTCPSCNYTLKTEKIIEGTLVILIQTCLQCEYRNEWKSQVDPIIADQPRTSDKKELRTDDNCSRVVISEIHTLSDKECDLTDEEEEGGEGPDSDEEWEPEDLLLAEELKRESEEETEDQSGSEEDDHLSPGGLNQLCTECGCFHNIQKHHICEYKIKPYSCNICGKRYVTEIFLRNHSNVHDETHEYPCKYCYVTFKTKADKITHEQNHRDKKDRYKCPDCSATFATNKERFRHLKNHRGSKEFKCEVCGFEFRNGHQLRRHSVVHTGLKPYKCAVCQRGFSQAENLKTHMRQHTGERPYKCQHCDKCFTHNVSLKSHVQRYHRPNHEAQRNEGKINERSSDAGDAQDNRERGADSGVDKVVKEQHIETEVNKERAGLPTKSKRGTGRPKGRPKRDTVGHPGEEAVHRSRIKSAKLKRKSLKKTNSSDEEWMEGSANRQ